MMWLVRLALNRPYTFIVASILILILSVVAVVRTPTDIFPDINIPVVSVVWGYTGLAPEEMERRMVTLSERGITTTVNDIEHIESQSYYGIGVVKIFFQQGTDINGAVAQTTAIAQAGLRSMPPGTTPPLVIAYTASSVPILQLGLSSQSLSEGQLFDLGVNFLRVQLADIEGAAIPTPFGGKPRQVSVDLDPSAMTALGVSGADVVNAVSAQNLILPQGTIKLGAREYDVALNSSPVQVSELNDLPIKMVNGSMVYIRDVAHVHDGFQFQTNIVHVDGHRSALLSVFKTGKASTLDIVSRVYAELPRIQAGLPPALKINPIADQSLFVRGAIKGVLREAVVAALLTALMILIFLGSWRMTFVVSISIPLAALLNNQPMGFYSPATITKDAQRHGLKMLPVDVTCSEWMCTLEAVSRQPSAVSKIALRLGLRYVRGLCEEAAQALVRERACAPFASIHDLTRRVPELRKDELTTLAEIGALNSVFSFQFPVSRKSDVSVGSYWKPETGNSKLRFHRRDVLWQVERAVRGSGPLLEKLPEPDSPSPLQPMNHEERLVADFLGTGLTVGPHPMAYRRDWLNAMGIRRASELRDLPSGKRLRIGGCVIVRQRPGTAKGFVFVSLEDETGVANAIITPDLFHRNRLLLASERFLAIEGILQNQDNVISVKAERVLPLFVTKAETISHDFH